MSLASDLRWHNLRPKMLLNCDLWPQMSFTSDLYCYRVAFYCTPPLIARLCAAASTVDPRWRSSVSSLQTAGMLWSPACPDWSPHCSAAGAVRPASRSPSLFSGVGGSSACQLNLLQIPLLVPVGVCHDICGSVSVVFHLGLLEWLREDVIK